MMHHTNVRRDETHCFEDYKQAVSQRIGESVSPLAWLEEHGADNVIVVDYDSMKFMSSVETRQ